MYDDLSIEERIQKASEYAVILSGDERPDFDMISELKQTFSLNDEQAQQAYDLMRKNYEAEFQAAVKSKIQKGWMMVLVAGLFAVFYFVLAKETGGAFLIIVFIFGATAINVLANIAKSYRERSRTGAEAFLPSNAKTEAMKKKSYENIIGIPTASLCLLIFAFFFFYTKQRVVNLNEVREVMHVVVDGNVLKKRTKGKNRTDYFQFHFKNYRHTFEFAENMYKYGRWRIAKPDFKDGDTLDIAVIADELEQLQDNYDDHTIDLLNIRQKRTWLIDLQYRNERVNQGNKRGFIVVFIVFIVACLGVFLWIIFKKRKKDASKNHFT